MNGVLADRMIRELCDRREPMLVPFEREQKGKPSYGLSSCGYDLRLGGSFLMPLSGQNVVLDPCAFPDAAFKTVELEGGTFELAPHSQVLAHSLEWFNMPDNVFAVCYGKSSYARCGLLVNVTPLEPGWKGILTMELANVSPFPIRLHVGLGIAQVVFFKLCESPLRTYAEKESGGIYQNQRGATLPSGLCLGGTR